MMTNKALITIQIVDAFGNPIEKAQYQVKNAKTSQLIAEGSTKANGCIVEISRDKGTILDVYIKNIFNSIMIKVQSFTLSKDKMFVKITSPKVLLDLQTLINQGNNGQYKRKTHIVKKGETLTSIANQHHTTVRALERLNDINDPNKIVVGQLIKLPVKIAANGNYSHTDAKSVKPKIQSKTPKNNPNKTTTTKNEESEIDKLKKAAEEKATEWYKNITDAVKNMTSNKILTLPDRSKEAGTPKTDVQNLCKTKPQCIASGQKSELIREVNIRLAGFGGALPTDEFTELTAKCINQFQKDYMGVEPTGKICGSLLKAIDDFNKKYPIEQYVSSFACPCSKFGGGIQCKGFGANRSKQYKVLGKEAPGMHRSTIWILKAAQFYLEKEKSLGVKITGISSGYRCIENNAGHNSSHQARHTINHMGGAALDVIISNNAKLDEVRKQIFIKYMNASAIGTRSANHIFLESREQSATSWVHFDITMYGGVDITKKEYYGKTKEELINGNIMDLCKRIKPELLGCSGLISTQKNETSAINANIKAFLDTIAKSEGTYDLGDRGYNVMVTGKIMKDYTDHPFTYHDKALHVSGDLYSTASGRYQIMRANWYGEKNNPQSGLKYINHFKDFGPQSQDLAAIQLLKRRKAYELITQGKIRTAFKTTTLNKEWASFPGAGYSQREHKIEKIIGWYKSFGGTLTD